MSERESAIEDPLASPHSGVFCCPSLRRWFPRWLRILIAGGLVAAPILVLPLEGISDRWAFSMVAWSGWSAIAFVAMQGPGQWRNILGGTLYGIALALISLLVYRWCRPISFASWHTFWNIDFPLFAMDSIVGWCLLRMLSMISGIAIIDPNVRIPPRWTLARWLVLMAVLAILIQVSRTRLNWTAEMSMASFDKSMVGPLPESPIVTSRRFWIGVQLAEILLVPFVPILAAGWMLAGRPWRWLMFPILAALTIAEYALGEILVQEATKTLYRSTIDKEWALWGTLSWLVYCFAAILVPWMGFRWTDYWSRVPQAPSTQTSE